ncbi:MAG TPA: hypothetical protein PK906_15745 [Spirochaetota bacterium]|nr:hypothetical protein [Spirochaetota bacterium]
MKRILAITLFFLFILPSAVSFAAGGVLHFSDSMNFPSTEEFTASWEQEESSRIMGEAVLNDFREGGGSGFRMNALCSVQSMAEMKRIRERLFAIIEIDIISKEATEESCLAAEILAVAGELDITGLSCTEKSLIKKINLSPLNDRPLHENSFAGGGSLPERAALYISMETVNYSGNGSGTDTSIRNGTSFNYPVQNIIPCRKFETVHADYYRLFLYMRDDTGDSSCPDITYSYTLLCHHLFNSFQTYIQSNRPLKTTVHQRSNQFIIYSSLILPPSFKGGDPRRGEGATAKECFHEKV